MFVVLLRVLNPHSKSWDLRPLNCIISNDGISEHTDGNICNNNFTWCFHKIKQAVLHPRFNNLEQLAIFGGVCLCNICIKNLVSRSLGCSWVFYSRCTISRLHLFGFYFRYWVAVNVVTNITISSSGMFATLHH